MKRRVYIAGKFDAQDRLLKEAAMMTSLGFTVVGTWLWEEASPTGIDARTARAYAERDLDEIMSADFLVLDTQDDNLRGGREVECGAALAWDKGLIVVGPKRNVFHELAEFHYPDWRAFEAALGRARGAGWTWEAAA